MTTNITVKTQKTQYVDTAFGPRILIDSLSELPEPPTSKTDWYDLWAGGEYTFTEAFVEENIENVDWMTICCDHFISEAFYERHKDKLDWPVFIQNAPEGALSDDFLLRNKDLIPWAVASQHLRLSESVIEAVADKVDWEYISVFQNLSEDFMRRHQKDISWPAVSAYQRFSAAFFHEFQDKMEFAAVQARDDLPEEIHFTDELVGKNPNKVDWDLISTKQAADISIDLAIRFKVKITWSDFLRARSGAGLSISEEELEKCFSAGVFQDYDEEFFMYCRIHVSFLRRHKRELVWQNVFPYQEFSEAEIEEFADDLEVRYDGMWLDITEHQVLSEAFMRKHKDEVVWVCASLHQKLTDTLVDDFSGMLDWVQVSRNREGLSEGIMRKYADRLDWEYLCQYQVLSERLIEDFAYKLTPVGWRQVSLKQKLSEHFMEKHQDELDWEAISEKQTFSVWFARRFWDRLDVEKLRERNDLPFVIS